MIKRLKITIEITDLQSKNIIKMDIEEYKEFIKNQHELFNPLSEVSCGELIISDVSYSNQITKEDNSCNGNCKCMFDKGEI